MTTDVVTVNQNDDLRLVDDIMAEHGIRHIPVVHQDRLVGLITQRDMYKAQMSSAMGYGKMGQRAFLHTLLVKDFMTHPVTTIAPNTSVIEAIDLILKQRIGCLPVMQDRQLVGIITKTNLLQLLRTLTAPERAYAYNSGSQQGESTYFVTTCSSRAQAVF